MYIQSCLAAMILGENVEILSKRVILEHAQLDDVRSYSAPFVPLRLARSRSPITSGIVGERERPNLGFAPDVRAA